MPDSRKKPAKTDPSPVQKRKRNPSPAKADTATKQSQKPAVQSKKPATPVAKQAKKNGKQIEVAPAEPKLPATRAGKGKALKDKPKKAKLVRDSFTMPEDEYQVIGDIKKVCIEAGFVIKKSEMLRIGVALLQKMPAAQIQEALSALPALKAGRPKKEDAGTVPSE